MGLVEQHDAEVGLLAFENTRAPAAAPENPSSQVTK